MLERKNIDVYESIIGSRRYFYDTVVVSAHPTGRAK